MVIKKQNLSENQSRASDPTQNVWVQANAGTGKTSVLVQRLLRILFRSNNSEKSGILCLTYTNAGASEMRNRILAALRVWAYADDNELRGLLAGVSHNNPPVDEDLAMAREIFYEYIDNPQILKIHTIHGFCEEILRRFPIEAGIPPEWGLVIGPNQTRLQKDVFQELINGHGDASLNFAFARILDQVSEHSLDELLTILTGQYKHFFQLSNNFNNRQQFIDTINNSLNIKYNSQPAADEFYSLSAARNREQIAELVTADIASSKKPAGYLIKVQGAVKMFAANNYAPLKNDDWEEYKSAFLTAAGTKIVHIAKKDYLAEEQDLVYSLNQENINKEIFENTIALYDLTAAFAQKYRETKLSRCLMDFDDLILYTKKLFSDPEMMGWVLSQLDISLRHILVDEAQDTSPEQWEILNALTADFMTDGDKGDNPHTFFVVGDTKQSIYSFQGADPAAFEKSKQAVTNQIKNDARQIIDVPLEQSFRSTAPILSAVNHFFNDVSISNLANFINNSHKCFRLDDKGLVELHPLSKPAENQDSATGRRQFILEIAGKIENLIKNEQSDDPARRILPSDIMVLVQRRRPYAAPLIAELQKSGIPVAGSDRIKLPEFPAIRDLLNLIRFCLDIGNDYALSCVLKSPLFQLGESELYELCHNRGKTNLFNRINELNIDIYTKLQHILEWAKLSPYSFFMRVLNTDKRREKMIAALGPQIIDPLEEFLTICLSYERTRPGGLCEFIEWFIQGGSEITRDVDAAAGVRIATVHGSKGLESPIVFLIDTTRNPRSANAMRIAEPIEISGGTHHAFLWRGRTAESESFSAVTDARYKTRLAEYYRLLYVAMTRARDRLYIYGFDHNKMPPADAWHTQLTQILSLHQDAKISENGIISIAN
ncbi:MAG: UvrD-helicase domain-containing protein [Rickettsiales bacterium]|jgi:ATP-dependent helicase/nuclease subunit A|nr:UvrD-helicase domain-containing protein [Rickettsiales bacterium]